MIYFTKDMTDCPVCGNKLVLEEYGNGVDKKNYNPVNWKKMCKNTTWAHHHYYQNSEGKISAEYPTHSIINMISKHYGNCYRSNIYSITNGDWHMVYQSEELIPFHKDLDFLLSFVQNKDLLK